MNQIKKVKIFKANNRRKMDFNYCTCTVYERAILDPGQKL